MDCDCGHADHLETCASLVIQPNSSTMTLYQTEFGQMPVQTGPSAYATAFASSIPTTIFPRDFFYSSYDQSKPKSKTQYLYDDE